MNYLAPAKLNLFLHVVGRRADGYHLLQSLMTMVDFSDRLEISVREDGKVLRINDIAAIPSSDDLVVRAAHALKARTGTRLGASMTLHKQIPTGAGLGGGSSDAATTLLALNQLWSLNLSHADLHEIGLSLGADVPFFLTGTSAFAEGIGEQLTPMALPAWWYVVADPGVHVSTPFVFGQADLTRDTPGFKIADFSAASIESCKNDLQAVVLKAFPAVATALAALSEASKKSIFGARMSGSGGSVFAAFESERDARDALNAFLQLAPKNTGFVAKGLDKHPML